MSTGGRRLRLLCIVLQLHTIVALAATSPKPKRIIWKGVETFENAYTYHGRTSGALGYANEYFAKTVITFTYVEETDSAGNSHFTSRKIAWNSSGRSLAYGFEGTTCKGSGQADVTKADQKFDIPCETQKYGVFWGFFPRPPSSISPPKIITWDQLRDDCSYSEEQPWDHGFHRYSVSVAADVDAVMEASTGHDSEYWQFVPAVGKKISFSVRSNVPARFRFTLENVSHFPGFATNANVDEDFFAMYGLDHDQYLDQGQYLRDHYKNEDADLIFDPQDFADNKKHWKRPPADMQVMETAQDASGASVTVTAMDFGAYGHLRAEVKTKCGGWQPVRIRMGGQDRSFVTIPMDENNNLIADRMEQSNNGITAWAYTGDPGSDEDGKPTGDGKTGDGLTAFEEYRGFMIEENPGDPWTETHVRTDPSTKDIFITSDDSGIERDAATVFADLSGLNVHTINAFRFVEDPVTTAPVVNFTLQSKGSKQWNGKTVSQATPQHGVRIVVQSLEDGENGHTYPVVGPPKNVSHIAVDKTKCNANGPHLSPLQLARVVSHELGHAMNIPHHGELNMRSVVFLNQSSCPEHSTAGTVDGKPACRFDGVAVRHQQNSGDQDCPMKYIWWAWYLPPSAHTFSLDIMASCKGQPTKCVEFDNGSSKESLPGYNADLPKLYIDKVVTKETDYPGLIGYCTRNTGTGINALAGDQNRAGDAPDNVWCAKKLHVNDVKPVP